MNKKLTGLFIIIVGFTLSSTAQVPQEVVEANTSLRLVTWNIEHLAEGNGQGCVSRNEEDYIQLRDFASTMEADIVALQEVESAKAVARVFSEEEWEIVVSSRPDSPVYECRGSGRPSTQQKVAFAVRKGVAFKPVEDFDELAIDRAGLRYGLIIQLVNVPEPIYLMNVHLKSGCFVDNYSASDRDACNTFEQQVPVLDNWIEEKEKEGAAFVILGDFNHRITKAGNRFWSDLNDMDGALIDLKSSMEGTRGCHPRYPDPIDHIVANSVSQKYYIEGSEEVHYFGLSPETMKEEDMLSDHCPVSVDLHVRDFSPTSSAVRWTQNSAEYNLITSFLYNQAEQNVEQFSNFSEPWVVIMDVDETLLDNSGYNKRRDQLGLEYSSKSWADWVREEDATEVPGSRSFVSAVLEAGGQIALITNRDRTLDAYTWNNLFNLGFPINRNNTCIMGRSPADKGAVGEDDMINDKDLRRQQVSEGTAGYCWENHPEAEASWNRPLTIVMQVGDNIKDFAGTTQQNVDLDEFLKRQGIEILVLPNAMYGSWE